MMMHSILVRKVTSTLIFNFYVIIIGRIQKLLKDKVTMTNSLFDNGFLSAKSVKGEMFAEVAVCMCLKG